MKKIEVYRTNDGVIFNTEEDAEAHEIEASEEEAKTALMNKYEITEHPSQGWFAWVIEHRGFVISTLKEIPEVK